MCLNRHAERMAGWLTVTVYPVAQPTLNMPACLDKWDMTWLCTGSLSIPFHSAYYRWAPECRRRMNTCSHISLNQCFFIGKDTDLVQNPCWRSGMATRVQPVITGE